MERSELLEYIKELEKYIKEQTKMSDASKSFDDVYRIQTARIAELEAENERLLLLLREATQWNWLDEDADAIPCAVKIDKLLEQTK